MTHLGERVTDYVFGELSAAEMAEAQRHLAACADCRKQVEQFEGTRALLQMSPDIEPPRRIVFEAEKRRTADLWRWLVPAGLAAAVLISILLAAPIRFQWNDSQLTIAIGRPPVSDSAQPVQQPPAPVSPVVQPVDYERIVRQVQDAQQAWLAGEIAKRDAARSLEIQRLRDQLVYVEAQQHLTEKQNVDNAANIQLLAQKSGLQD